MRITSSYDGDHRVEGLADVLVPTITPEELAAAEGDISRGDGAELSWEGGKRPKLHSVYSSCGLALNTFAPWRLAPASLRVAGRGDFAELRFEQQLRIFRGGRAPNLDVVLTAPGRILAIESKLTEYLGIRKRPSFSDAYERRRDASHPSWWSVYEGLRDGGSSSGTSTASNLSSTTSA
jgi:hypothetical protein